MLRLGRSLLTRRRRVTPHIVVKAINIPVPEDETTSESNLVEGKSLNYYESLHTHLSEVLPESPIMPQENVTQIQPSFSYMDPMILQAKLAELKRNERNILISSSDKKLKALHRNAKHLTLVHLFTKHPADKIHAQGLLCANTNIVASATKFPDNVNTIAVFEHLVHPLRGLPITIILDGADLITDHELTRHLRQSRHCGRFWMPGGETEKLRERLYGAVDMSVLGNCVRVDEMQQWNEIEDTIMGEVAAVVIYGDVLSSQSATDLFDFEMERWTTPPSHVYIVVSPTGEFSSAALSMRERCKSSHLFHSYNKRHRLESLKLDICDLTPQIEQDVKERVSSFTSAEHYPGVVRRNKIPGTPVLSSTLTNSIISEITQQLGH